MFCVIYFFKISSYTVIDNVFALSVIINFDGVEITDAELQNVYITFNEPIVTYEKVYTEHGTWYDTGIAYIPGEPVTAVELSDRINALTAEIEELKDEVEIIEEKIEYISTSTTSTSLPPNYWISRIDEIGPKIEALQKEYGVDAFQFLWTSDIHDVPGSLPSNTTHIGEISRYIMDKYNIPFLTISGDLHSQASYTKIERIWQEYDRINAMLSPIKNNEFLTVKGNHDGAWGVGDRNGITLSYAKNIGTKALFNAFYRRQTLDRNRVFGNDGTYFYVDSPGARLYMLNSHTDGDNSVYEDGTAVYNSDHNFVFGNEQLNWVANSLLTVEESKKVIFMAHAPIRFCLDGSILTGILTSYKNKIHYKESINITGEYWGNDEKYSTISVDKDFTNAKGDLVGYFHGHIHKDTISINDDFVEISITTAGGPNIKDDYFLDGTLNRVKGTATETAIDLVTVTSDYIYLTRIGSGYDRKYNRLTKEITIDYDSAY